MTPKVYESVGVPGTAEALWVCWFVYPSSTRLSFTTLAPPALELLGGALSAYGAIRSS